MRVVREREDVGTDARHITRDSKWTDVLMERDKHTYKLSSRGFGEFGSHSLKLENIFIGSQQWIPSVFSRACSSTEL